MLAPADAVYTLVSAALRPRWSFLASAVQPTPRRWWRPPSAPLLQVSLPIANKLCSCRHCRCVQCTDLDVLSNLLLLVAHARDAMPPVLL